MGRGLRSILVVVLIGTAAALGFGIYRWCCPAPSPRTQTLPPVSGSMQSGESTIPPLLPDFVLKDGNNQPRSIAEWKGKSLVINFWATWCPPCRAEIPLLKTVDARRAAENFQVIGIAVDARESVLAYAKEAGIEYPLLIGEQDAVEVAAQFGVAAIGLPFTVFTDDRGRIVTLHLGQLHAPEMDGILDTVLKVNQGALTLAQAKQQIASLL